MTENKRFMIDTAGTLIDMVTRDTFDYVSDVVGLLNELSEENEELRTKNNAYIQDVEVYREENTHLKLENEQLKQRNTNQYNQLNQLWQLIKAKDWETLTEMDNQMKEDEEQLQKEWKCYCE